MEFLKIGIIQLIDITLVAILIYQLYKLVKGTVAINIFIGLAAIYLIWKIVSAFHFQLLSEILGQFIGLGVIILAIVFQQELRKFLILIGRSKLIKTKGRFKFNLLVDHKNKLNTSAIIDACVDMAKTKTGAIIVITNIDNLSEYSQSGTPINATISTAVIKSIFYKNSPLHDGAVIITNNKIISARCILPVTNNEDFPNDLGTRHRAAVGITEESDAIAVIVSEETGSISYVKDGELFNKRTGDQLKHFLNRSFNK